MVGGCLRKVDLAALGVHVLGIGDVESTLDAGLPDVETTQLPGLSRTIATSVDLVYDFGAEGRDLGWISVVHALSDLYASLSVPVIATLALGVRQENLRESRAIVTGARAAMAEHGITFGGGHTVYADRTFVCVSAVGLDPLDGGFKPGTTYTIMLSKPVGVGLRLAERQIVGPAVESWRETISMMRSSNRAGSAALRRARLDRAWSVALVTDVTGYGLLTALRAAVPEGWCASVKGDQVPVLSGVRQLIEGQGISTGLGEHNVAIAREDSKTDCSGVPLSLLLTLSDPQTSGGLVAAVTSDVAEELETVPGSTWTVIGTMRETDLDVRVVVKGG